MKMMMLQSAARSHDSRSVRRDEAIEPGIENASPRYYDEMYGVEDRTRDRKGREHYDNGRYAPKSRDYGVEPREKDWSMEPIGRVIGFNAQREKRSAEKMKKGGATGAGGGLDEETAKKWAHSMDNGDGGKEERWNMEQAKRIMQSCGFHLDPVEFYAILNAMRSDFHKVAQKYSLDNEKFYADLARAWLEDKDAVDNKALMYYECIVDHSEE